MKRIPRLAGMPGMSGLFGALALCLLCRATPTLAAQKFDAQTGIDMQQAGLEKMSDGTYMAARGPMEAKTVRVLVRFSGTGTLDQIRALGAVVHSWCRPVPAIR